MDTKLATDAKVVQLLRGITRRQHYGLHVHISTLFIALIVISGTLIGWHNYRQNSALILAASDDLFERIARETTSEIGRVFTPIEAIVDTFAYQRVINARTLAQRLDSLPYMREALRQSNALSALYIGYDNGDFFLVRPLTRNPELMRRFAAPDNAQLVVQSVERNAAGHVQGRYLFFDDNLKLLSQREETGYTFDPRSRGWYQSARRAAAQIATAPYVYFTTRDVGTTLARRAQNGNSVVGADLTLTDLSAALQRQQVSPSAQLAIFDEGGNAIAYPKPEVLLRSDSTPESFRLATVADLGVPVLTAALERFHAGELDRRLTLDANGREWKGRVAKLTLREGHDFYLAVAAPTDELLANATAVRTQSIWITLGILLLTIPIAWLASRAIARPLRQLSDDAAAFRRFQFDRASNVDSFISEVDELAQAMDIMRATIRKFLEISAALGEDRDLDHLLNHVISESLTLTGADKAAMYLLEDDGVTLTPTSRVRRDAKTVPHELQPLDLRRDTNNQIAAVAREGQSKIASFRLGDADPTARYFVETFAGLGADRLGIASIPLHNREHDIVGVLVFVCRLDAAADTKPFTAELISFMEALSGTVAVSIEARRLLKAQTDLLNSFIQLIAGAIDAKSPYTGGHCQRVPEITFMLARAACDAKEGPYKDFTLSDDEWEAVKIASWLHDCGKVTTPEYVVDKATKLETINDRIHEVRTRFEVLKRDAEIAYWKAVAQNGDGDALRAKLKETLAALDADFAFVAECNLGGEFMAPDKVERIGKIAQRTWQRTLDDRLGVSWEERARKERTPAAALPATEQLLANKPEHVIERDAQDNMPADNPWGFKVDVPKAKFNKGEIYNLCIGRGTLTAEERFKINDHMVQTIIMLNRLPFPKHLRQVPEIAGGHHEKMDGTGYPKRLRREEMSPVARMMAIADIFEALTAGDRPYKKGKTLSEAIGIMGGMKKGQHIDPELFDLFLTSGVYRRYAEQYLKPEQIDTVDIRQYVDATPAQSKSTQKK
jgi:HD-GYP domain-containing protein (c-di-GMP phosphodiesterase class II)